MKLTLTHIGRDNWERPVYECNGKLYVDVDPRKALAPHICTKQFNEFHGEPKTEINAEFEFVPARDVWD